MRRREKTEEASEREERGGEHNTGEEGKQKGGKVEGSEGGVTLANKTQSILLKYSV